MTPNCHTFLFDKSVTIWENILWSPKFGSIWESHILKTFHFLHYRTNYCDNISSIFQYVLSILH